MTIANNTWQGHRNSRNQLPRAQVHDDELQQVIGLISSSAQLHFSQTS